MTTRMVGDALPVTSSKIREIIEGHTMNNSIQSPHPDELLFQYVGLKAQIRALQHELREMYPDVIEIMKELDEKREVGGAVLTYRTRNRYKFSARIESLAHDLKVRKQHEIEAGIAEVEGVTESVFVRFKKAGDGMQGADVPGPRIDKERQ